MSDITITNGWDVEHVNPVEFVSIMGNDDAVCDAARVSFDKKAAGYSVGQNKKLIDYLAKHDHWSPFSHCFIKFRFKAPMFIARQFQKHVVGFSWNEVSRRYVDSPPSFFVPFAWRKRPENMKQGSVLEDQVILKDDVLKSYVNQMAEHAKDYKTMISQGFCPEQVRMLMPQAMMTEWIWTGSLMAWARFCKLRGDSHAQYECWKYSEAVSHTMLDHFPLSAKALMRSHSPNGDADDVQPST